MRRIKLIGPGFYLLFLALLAGCGGGTMPLRYYLIDPVAYPGMPGMGDEPLAIEVMDVHIPQYLERFNIAVRGDDNQLVFANSHQWGENLRKNLLRTLARNLSALLSTNDVGTPINRSMSVPDLRVQVHIEQFERDNNGRVVLIARWQLTRPGNNTAVYTHRAELESDDSVAADDYDAIVARMQGLYGQLSRAIAISINDAAGSGR